MPDRATAQTLPTLDLNDFGAGGRKKAAYLNELRAAARRFGFFYLVGHGVKDSVVRDLIGLSRAFFALPEADKLAIEMVNSPQFRGFTRAGFEYTRGEPDWREQLDVVAGQGIYGNSGDPRRRGGAVAHLAHHCAQRAAGAHQGGVFRAATLPASPRRPCARGVAPANSCDAGAADMISLARRALTPLALIITAAAVYWWWRTFGEVVGYGYLSWPEASGCLIRDSDICTLAKALCLGSHPRALIGYAAIGFWIGHTYELAITRLWLKSEEGHTRPAIATAPLFRGHQGTLTVELWNAENKAIRGTVAPVFYTAAGEVLNLPERFDEATRKITGAVACSGCKHTHVAVAPAHNKGGEL